MPEIRRFTAILFLGLALGLVWNAPVMARSWMDDVMNLCHRNAKSGKASAIAYSDTGIFSCSWNQPSLQVARNTAIRDCTAGLPSTAKRGAPCRIIVENRRTTDADTVRRLKKPIRLAAQFEIFDKKSGNRQAFNGFIELGRLDRGKARKARLITSQGLMLCEGVYAQSRNTINIGMLCFDEFQFNKSGILPRNYTYSDGFYKPNFQVRLTRDGSYLNITSLN